MSQSAKSVSRCALVPLFLLCALAVQGADLVSVNSDEQQTNNLSTECVISRDGRYVAFTSSATNLITGDTNAATDVFVRDVVNGTTERVSVTGSGTQINGNSSEPAISGDGRYVVFTAVTTPSVGNLVYTIYRRDRTNGTTATVAGPSPNNVRNGTAGISADGRYVAFVSAMTTLVSGDINGVADCFVKDMDTGTVTRVSVRTGGTEMKSLGGAATVFQRPSISDDGNLVAFTSSQVADISIDANDVADVYVHDRQTVTTTYGSLTPGGAAGAMASQCPALSANGRYLLFHSKASDLVAGDTNGWDDVFVRDMQLGETTRVSVLPDGTQGGSASQYAAISFDARYVAFVSYSSNFAVGDTNGVADIFHVDRQSGTWTVVSKNGEAFANGASYAPSVSGDGRYVAFPSNASNLAAFDSNSQRDIFLVEIASAGNHAPVAQDLDLTAYKNTSLSATFQATDADNNDLTFTVLTQPAHGTLTTGANDSFTYRPETGYLGVDSFTYLANDGAEDSAPATVTITVTVPNFTRPDVRVYDPLTDQEIGDDVYAPDEQRAQKLLSLTDQEFVYRVQNDGDVAGAIRLYGSAAGAYKGRYYTADETDITDDVLAGVYYTPTVAPGEYFPVTFRLAGASLPVGGFTGALFARTGPGEECTDEAQVSLSALQPLTVVLQRSSAPYYVNVPITLTGSASGAGVEYQFYVIDRIALTTTIIREFASEASCQYAPTDPGTYAFRVDARVMGPPVWKAGTATSIDEPVSFRAPVATDGALELVQDTRTTGALTASDPDGHALTYSVVAGPTRGTLDAFDAATGEFAYQPAAGAIGADSFTFKVNDGHNDSNTATMSIYVRSDRGVSEIVSVSSAEAQGNQHSLECAISRDGRFVAFASIADNLVSMDKDGNGEQDTNDSEDVFVRDVLLGTTERVSRDNFNDEIDGDSCEPAISADGRYVVFTAKTHPLIGRTSYTIYRRDRVTGMSVMVTNGGALDVRCGTAAISGDGRYVAFVSENPDLVAGDLNGGADVFVKDMNTGVVTRVSVKNGGGEIKLVDGGPATFERPAISDDGNLVAFTTEQRAEITDENDVSDVLVHNRQTLSTVYASVTPGGVPSAWASSGPSLSPDGRYLAFSSFGADLVDGDTNHAADIFLRDLQTGQTVRVNTLSGGGQANGGSISPALSSDARYVAFLTWATNYAAGDGNGQPDVVHLDRQTGAYEIVSRKEGIFGNGASYAPSISGDGRRVAYPSNANNLAPVDESGARDIFLWHMPPPNELPVAEDGALEIDEDSGAATGTLVATDAENDPLTYSIVSNGALGVAVVTDAATGAYSYTPGANAHDVDTFTFKASDARGQSNVATITVTIASINDLPTAQDGALATGLNLPMGGALHAADADGEALEYIIVAPPEHGDLTVNASTGKYKYVPASGYTGADAFTFKVNDGQADSNTATVSITVSLCAPTRVVSVDSNETLGNSGSSDACISGSGRFVVFHSFAGNLVPGDTNGVADVFVRDLWNGVTERVSVAPDGSQGNGDSWLRFGRTLSSDGRYVVFMSSGFGDLFAGTAHNYIYVRDRQAGVTERVSKAFDGDLPSGQCFWPNISPNGRYVVYQSYAANIVDGDPLGFPQIYRYDRNTGETICASRRADGVFADSECHYPTVTNAGEVFFSTYAFNLGPVDGNGWYFDVYRRDAAGVFSIVSLAADGQAGDLHSNMPAVDESGVIVTFNSNCSNLVAGDTNGAWDVYLRNLTTGAVTRVSVASDGSQGDAPSYSGRPSDDGRFVVFQSNASNLVAGDTNGMDDCFIRELATGQVRRVSRGLGGAEPDGTCSEPALSADGRLAVFFSDATNLAANDVNLSHDIFLVDLLQLRAPVAQDGAESTDEDVAVSGAFSASDADGDPLVFSIVDNGALGVAVVTDAATGAFTYTPNANAAGTDSFTFRAFDGTSYSNVATVSITVTPVNDAPTAADQNVSTAEDTAVDITLGASDVEGDALTWIVDAPAHGTLSGTAPDLRYTPDAGWSGSDSFTFKVNDGALDSNVATVTITVTPVNDAPTAADQNVSTAEDTAVDITLGASDVEGDALTWIVDAPAHGTLSGTAPDLRYTPDAGWSGSDSFTFKVNDGALDSNVATVSITVTPAPRGVTVRLLDSLGAGLEGGEVQYYQGGWKPFGVTGADGTVWADVAPGTYVFAMLYAHGRAQARETVVGGSVVTFRTTRVRVELRDSAGAPLDTGEAQYNAGGWRTFGSTLNGDVSKELLPAAYGFAMDFAGGCLKKTQDVSVDPVVVFRTTRVVVRLKDSAGAALDTGVAQYYSTAWQSFGSTLNGEVAKELLPAFYVFTMSYADAVVKKTQNVGADPVVVFQTARVTVRLRDSGWNPLNAGVAQYYAGGWRSMGALVNGEVSKELLPAAYTFSMLYAGGLMKKNQNVAVDPLVVFQTVNVVVWFRDSFGNPLDTGEAQYYAVANACGWLAFGVTTSGEVARELLPVPYVFAMNYAGGRKEKSQNVAVDPVVVFGTGRVHSSGACTQYYARGWRPFTQDMELLPLTYTFRFSVAPLTQSIAITAGTVNEVR
jgi:VCBS repeat-containing protein